MMPDTWGPSIYHVDSWGGGGGGGGGGDSTLVHEGYLGGRARIHMDARSPHYNKIYRIKMLKHV